MLLLKFNGGNMANNRMYLVCRICGKSLLIGKILGIEFYIPPCYSNCLEKKLNDFYVKHSMGKCSKNGNNSISAENQFELRYESAIDSGMKEL